ncbi:MAG: hypothetical protein HY303_11270, partial [Candidatus Wallbacteria bacterium]|nr:hypothetical protein [Candidatus Wallbacteria bacterium]
MPGHFRMAAVALAILTAALGPATAMAAAPSITSVTYSKIPNAYTSGDVLTVTAVFDQQITPTSASITVTGGTVGDITVTDQAMSNPSADLLTWVYSATITATDVDASRTVDISGTNANGNNTSTPNNAFTVDKTAPTISSVTYSKTPNAYKGGDSLEITAVFDEDITPSAAAITITGGNIAGGAVNGTAMTNPSADRRTWLFEATVVAGDATAGRTVQVSGSDAAGNTNGSTPSSSFSVDNVAPSITGVTYSKTPNAYKGGDSLEITAVFDEDITPSAAAITITGGNIAGGAVNGTAMTNPSLDRRTWLYSVILDGNEGTGPRTVLVSGADAAGNVNGSTPSDTFDVDNTPPGFSGFSFSRGPAFVDAGSLSVTAAFLEPLSASVTPTISFVPAGNFSPSAPAATRVDNQTFLYTTSVTGSTSQAGDAYTVTIPAASVIDVAGNAQNAPDDVQTGVVDTAAPLTPTLQFSQGPTFLVAGALTVTATFTEDITTTATPTLSFSPASDFSVNGVTRSGGNQVFVYSVTVGGPTPQAGEPYTATVSGGKDPAGNTQSPATQSGTEDTSPPLAPNLSFSRGPAFLAAGSLTITADFTEPLSGAFTPTIQFTGVPALFSPNVVAPTRNTNQQFVYTTTVTGTSSQAGDGYLLTLSKNNVVDVAGNVQQAADAQQSGIVDTVAPTVTGFTYSKASRIYKAETFLVTATFIEDITPAAAFITIAGGSITSTLNDVASTPMNQGANRQTWTFSRLVQGGNVDDGTFTITLTALDSAGNALTVQPVTNTFTVDTVTPQMLSPLTFSRSPAFLPAGPFSITANFSEALDPTVTPAFNIAGNGGPRFTNLVTTRISPQQYAFDYTISGNTSAGGDGYTISVLGASVQDLAGNTQTTTTPVTVGVVDTVAPTVTLTYTPPKLIYKAEALTLTAIFSEDITPASPTIAIVGGAITSTANDTPATPMDPGSDRKHWSHLVNIAGGGVDDGSFTITLTAADPAGNALTAQPANRTYPVDTVPPRVTGLSFSRGPDFIGAGPLTITADFSEDLDATDPRLLPSGVGGARFSTFITTRVSDRQFRYATTVSGSTSQKGDAYRIEVDATTVTDPAGNPQAGPNAFQSGLVDTVAPTVTSLTYSRIDRLYPLVQLFAVTASF